MASQHGFASWRRGFFTGAFSGAILALLLAPRPGSQTRKVIVDTSRQAYGTGEKVIEPAKKATTAVMSLKGRIGKEKKEPAGGEAAEKMEQAA